MAAMEVEEQAEFKTFEPMPGLGEKPEKKIGIYIACHGELIERTVNGPRNVTINKQNLGGYGCPSYKVREPHEHLQIALDLEVKLVGCSREQYKVMKDGLIDKYGVEIDTEGACERFSSMRNSWVLKKYSYDATKRAFIIAFQGTTMDMVTCTRPELETFILGKPGHIDEKDENIIDEFFTHRGTPNRYNPKIFTFFYTKTLFNLIYLFNKYQGVNVANIY